MLHKFMKRVGPELHIFMNAVVLFICAVLALAVVVLLVKHEEIKSAMYFFANQAAIASKQRYVGADAVEDAQMLATTIASVPTKPLIDDKQELQKLVSLLSAQTKRDIVVEDTHQIILADSIQSNVGKTYLYGQNMDALTIKDGAPRRFTEKSIDYPNGEDEVVVAIKNTSGKTLGALIMSTSHIFDDK